MLNLGFPFKSPASLARFPRAVTSLLNLSQITEHDEHFISPNSLSEHPNQSRYQDDLTLSPDHLDIETRFAVFMHMKCAF
jgi:hypothetical protein